jgi:erythromycin esterase-like protein
MWDTDTFLAALEQLRRYDRSVPPTRRVHLIGFDTQNTAGAIAYLRTAVPSDVTALLARLIDHDGHAWASFTADERATVRQAMTKIANGPTDSAGASSRANRRVLAAQSLLFRFELLESSDDWHQSAARDAAMAKLALSVLALEHDGRATLWGHVAHIGREFIIGQPTMGAHLTTALGATYRAYGLLAANGSVQAWDADQKLGVVPQALPSLLPYSAEAVLGAHARSAEVTYWNFRAATGDLARWLGGVHPIHELGAVAPHGRAEWNWDLHALDGTILFQNVTATTPTPTGERHAKPSTAP